MGTKGLVWSASAMGVLLHEGIGDTIRVSLTPRPGGDRREEVYAACELLQALGLRAFAPSVTACPGCGRTTSTTFQELAEARAGLHPRAACRSGRQKYDGVETLTLAVMGCVVNGPGESKAANIGISLPGTGEAPNCPVFIDGVHATTLQGHLRRARASPSRSCSTTTSRRNTRRSRQSQSTVALSRVSVAVTIRPATPDDRAFVLALAERLVVVRRAAHGARSPSSSKAIAARSRQWFDAPPNERTKRCSSPSSTARRPAARYLVTLVDYFNERPHAHLSVLAVAEDGRRARASARRCSISRWRGRRQRQLGSTDAERARHQRPRASALRAQEALAANTSGTCCRLVECAPCAFASAVGTRLRTPRHRLAPQARADARHSTS